MRDLHHKHINIRGMSDEKQTKIPSNILGDMGIALARFKCGKMGFLFREKATLDYGIDGEIEIMSEGVATGRLVAVQVKCGSSFFERRNEHGFEFSFESRHYEYWRNHSLPVIGILVHPEQETCYWGLLSNETIQRTGKRYKVTIPLEQTLSEQFSNSLTEIATPIIPDRTFEVFREEHPNTGFARRVSIYVRLNAADRPWTRESIRRLILQITSESRSKQFDPSEMSAVERQEGSPAEVVWIYVYRSETDRVLGAFLARSVWVSRALPKEHQPIGFDGDKDPSGVTIEWNETFQDIVRVIDERRSSKAEYIQYVLASFGAVESLFKTYYYQAPIKGSEFDYSQYLNDYEKLTSAVPEALIPPRECQRLDDSVAEMFVL